MTVSRDTGVGDLLVCNGLLITVDRQRRIFRRGAVYLQGGRIADVGESVRLEAAYPDAPRLDAAGGIVMPGLVDAHVHLTESIMRGFALDVPAFSWIRDRLRPMEHALTSADIRVAAELCLLEFLRSGTTTFVESLFPARADDIDGVAELILASGLRGALSIVRQSPADEAIVRQAHLRWHGRNDRLWILTALRPLAAVTPEIAVATGHLARDLETRLSWHFQPVKNDPRPLGTIASELDLLWPGALLGHGFGIDEADIGVVAQSGASVVTLPATNMRLAMGSCPVPELLAAGVAVALGTDGENSHDLFRTLALTGQLHKLRTGNATILPVEALIEMATLQGARALGLEAEIGSLEVGKRADLIILETRNPGLHPLDNPLGSVVYGAAAGDVTTVIVGGRVLMQGRHQTIFDERAILEKTRTHATSLLSRAGITELAAPRWPILE